MVCEVGRTVFDFWLTDTSQWHYQCVIPGVSRWPSIDTRLGIELLGTTGMKCLPVEAVQSANGTILHDSHAETVAIRAFNRFLIDECYKLSANDKFRSEVVELQKPRLLGEQPFIIRDDERF